MGVWPRRVSFRARLSTLIALAVGVTVAVAAVVSYFAVRHQLYHQEDASLRAETATLTAGPQFVHLDSLSQALQQSYAGSILQVVQADKTIIYASNSVSPLPVSAEVAGLATAQSASAGAAANSNPPSRIDTVQHHGVTYRVLTESVQVREGLAVLPAALQVARPLTDILHSLSILRLILFIVALAGVALAVGIGYVVARATIRPVERLTAAAEHVAATQDLDSTIEEAGDDELTRLARSFNAMLGALGASRQQQAQLVSDAGHELRTPLTSLRTNIEFLMRAGDLPATDREEVLSDVRAQLEELTTLIGDVVELARQDEQQAEPTEIRLDELVERAVERARRRAPGLSYAAELTRGSVRAQPALLERAVLNLLDNAAKWSPPGGRVEVRLQRRDRWQLDVRDHGPGIAPEDLPRVFDRFYRAPTARSLPGSGLGLAIVRQVITAHGGSVTASCPPDGGTLIHVELPIVAEAEPELPAYLPPALPARSL
jgi:two-component system sensor histidine kinase MprB